MIKYEEGNLNIEGNGKSVTQDWINLTDGVVTALANELGASKEFIFNGLVETYERVKELEEEE